MTRNRSSAKKAGTDFENLIADGLAEALGDRNIRRAPRWGSKDKGDIVNVRIDGHDLVIQTKCVARMALPSWVSQAKVQSVNADALCGIVIHKRYGTRNPMDQWVSCTVRELVALLTKQRQYEEE